MRQVQQMQPAGSSPHAPVPAAEPDFGLPDAVAQRNGWSPEELRKLGIGEAAKRTRVRKRAGAGNASQEPQETAVL